MRKFALMLVRLIVAQVGCIKSQMHACMQDLEDPYGSDTMCTVMIGFARDGVAYCQSVGNASAAQNNEQAADAFLVACIQYLVEQEKCRHKSTIKPGALEL